LEIVATPLTLSLEGRGEGERVFAFYSNPPPPTPSHKGRGVSWGLPQEVRRILGSPIGEGE